MLIDSIQNGIVIDHITAGKAMELYQILGLDKLACTVAILKNVTSGKLGRKDIIKIEGDVQIDLDVLGFIDHNITSIQDYIDPEILLRYDTMDINMYQANIFHCRMLIKEMQLQNYLFKTDVYELDPRVRLDITNQLRREMIEIFSGRNIYG